MVAEVGDYWLVRFLFQRGLALLYLLARSPRPPSPARWPARMACSRSRPTSERRTFRERPCFFYLVPDDRPVSREELRIHPLPPSSLLKGGAFS
jgi:hypothetical protein